ncbi:MAG: carbohydrate ABC transporter permease [Thermomicrobiales bacterium]
MTVRINADAIIPPGGPSRPASRGSGRSRSVRRETLYGYAFLSPALILFVVFIAGPLLGAIALSFFKWDLFSTREFIGLRNYRDLRGDKIARMAIRNSFVFAFGSIVLHIGVGLLLALAVNRPMHGALRYFLRTAFFFPLLISWASVSLIWLYALNPNFGFFNYYLHRIGFNPPNWLVDRHWAMTSLLFVDLWRTLGFTFIILLAGLQGVPRPLYEAAMLDGAGAGRQFLNITLPMISPTLFFVLVLNFIGAFQIFEPMFIMTNGGPVNSTRSLVQHIFETGFRSFEMGYASAMAIVVFAVIMIATGVQFIVGRYWVHYE